MPGQVGVVWDSSRRDLFIVEVSKRPFLRTQGIRKVSPTIEQMSSVEMFHKCIEFHCLKITQNWVK